MKILNKNLTILLLFCFCVLSINMISLNDNKEAKGAINFETIVNNSTNPEHSNGSIKFIFSGTERKIKLFVITNSQNGTKTYDCNSKEYTINGLYVGKYKVFLTDDLENKSEYQFEIK